MKQVRTEQSLWSLMDALVVAALVGILGALAIRDYHRTTAHFRITEALFLFTEVRASAHEFRAVHGRWPDLGEHVASSTFAHSDRSAGTHTRSVAYSGEGSLTFAFKEDVTRGQGEELSVRAATVPTNSSSAIVWVCGYSALLPGFTATTQNTTDIDPALLPVTCRDTRKGPQR